MLRNEGGGWSEDRLDELSPIKIGVKIRALPPRNANRKDNVRWLCSIDGGFTVATAYASLANSIDVSVESC
ncbi:hypothetical protein RJT34_05785 [Clitoria ternatea]|uniref:Uncharacterized protein n=1 Tax=Clitoria ternatea TaxID=43366 RepID=A0AAN9PTB4_CLITE